MEDSERGHAVCGVSSGDLFGAKLDEAVLKLVR